MKAAQITDYGPADAIAVADDVRRPAAGQGQILVAIRAASLNPVDSVIRSGMMRQMLPLKFPATLGGDFAGVIVEIGPGVDGLAIGDEVYGQALTLMGGTGTLAEFAAANAGTSARKPRTIDFIEAASLPLVGVSALQAITEHLNVQRGQRILILGAAGGIGRLAVQLAKHRGAHVTATVLPDGVDDAKRLAADVVIDATTQAFETVVRDVDGVLDTVGGESNIKAYGVLKRGGILVSMVAPPDAPRAAALGITALTQQTQTTSDRLAKLAALVDHGVLKPRVDRIFPLHETAAAFAYREIGHPRGKVVVVLSER